MTYHWSWFFVFVGATWFAVWALCRVGAQSDRETAKIYKAEAGRRAFEHALTDSPHEIKRRMDKWGDR